MRRMDVTDDDISNVIGLWRQFMDEEGAGDIDELLGRPCWHLFEAEHHLIAAACAYAGMRPPRNVAFSCLDSVEGSCECEAVLFWARIPASRLDPDRFVEGVAVRVHEYNWGGEALVVRRDEHVRYVIWRMSLLKDAMDKEAPTCISKK